jgi:hypothetical protein
VTPRERPASRKKPDRRQASKHWRPGSRKLNHSLLFSTPTLRNYVSAAIQLFKAHMCRPYSDLKSVLGDKNKTNNNQIIALNNGKLRILCDRSKSPFLFRYSLMRNLADQPIEASVNVAGRV